MEFETSFNSKLLLFGEYGLMFGAMALSVPFPRFSGKLSFDNCEEHTASNLEIRKFYEHLCQANFELLSDFAFDLEKLDTDLKKGMYFDSNIPQQCGVGSSGALVAALFSKYVFTTEKRNLSPEILKANFAVLESFFHGKSSGLDPLISYLDKPVLIDSKKQITTIDFDCTKACVTMALIDTQTTGATGPLVQHFIDRFNEPEFERVFENQFLPANNGCIGGLLNGDKNMFFICLESLIRFQLHYFRKMIPEHFYPIISDALNHGVFIKLLGSGGGGFLLAIAEDRETIHALNRKYDLEYLLV